ncbi:hypothetical protein MTR67_009463 [Solanum verrucosum]|uniref:Kelch repeat-containing F-box family protein n=1 Tax=Solanum verrucosum TaxID=315347 RepID=A0AAF0Q406_SOLVR|nr:hypothetical protein MTR67_009463 [Solanum verrucosum]
MGSLPFPSPSRASPRSPENSTSRYSIFASFCSTIVTNDATTTNWIACYDPSNNTWNYVTSIPNLPENHVLKDFAMVSVLNSLYIIGGRLCKKEKTQNVQYGIDEFFDRDIDVMSLVLRYDVNSNQWSKCAPLNVPRYNFAYVVEENKIYVAGGQSMLGSARGTSSTEVYDTLIDDGRWTLLTNMNRSRCKCVGVTWQGKIHVVGGFVQGGGFSQYVDRCSAELYDMSTGEWDLVAGMWQLDVPANQIVEVDGRLFSSGDCLNVWKGHVEVYDGKLNIWYMVEGSQNNIFPFEENGQLIHRLYLTMAPIGTHLYFLAGYRTIDDPSKTISTVYSFDTSATRGAWKSYEPIQEEGERELCSHCCVVQLY